MEEVERASMSLVSGIYRMSMPEIVTADDKERRITKKIRRLVEQIGSDAAVLQLSNSVIRKDDEPLRDRLIQLVRENKPASAPATA